MSLSGLYNNEGLTAVNGLSISNPESYFYYFSGYKDLKTSKNDKEMVIKLAIPGVCKEDIDITVRGDILEVACEKDTEFLESFTHAFSIKEYKGSNAEVKLENGVLTIKMEKKKEFKPKKLKLK